MVILIRENGESMQKRKRRIIALMEADSPRDGRSGMEACPGAIIPIVGISRTGRTARLATISAGDSSFAVIKCVQAFIIYQSIR